MSYQARFTKPEHTGIVIKEQVKCGKPNCRCANGKLHKWYFYHYFRVSNKGKWFLKKKYVQKGKVKELKQVINKTKEAKDREKNEADKQRLYLLGLKLFKEGLITKEEFEKVVYAVNNY
jgi:hypothetical protein